MLTHLPPPLQALGEYRQFCLYFVAPSKTKPGKLDKFPCDAQGRVVDAHNPANWMTAEQASQWAGDRFGIAFVFTRGDPFFFLDLDGALQEDGQWSPLAQTMCQAFVGCAVEVSTSGRGLHIIGRADVPEHGCRNAAAGLELYTEGRFIALTGTHAVGDASTPARPEVVRWLVDHYFPPRAGGQGRDADWTDGPCAEWRGPTDDDDLIRRAMRSQSARSALLGHASFANLWMADEPDILAASFPTDPGSSSPYNASSADAALAQHLAFWTGRDCARMERLMWRSGLKREKWERDDYLPRTILGACGACREVLQDKALEAPQLEAEEEAPESHIVDGTTYVDADGQLDMFGGCVYIRSQHRAILPTGEILKPEAFRVAFGGYMFVMDRSNQRHTADAWEAFTQSQIVRHRQAVDTCFRPDLPVATLVRQEGQYRVNCYAPVPVRREAGDPGLFLRHLELLIPDERDRTILLSYFAACAQYRGVKFGWAPLIQGTEGNGKTVLSKCVSYAVGRRYTHWPKASKLAAQFNGWMYGKLLYCVEDLYMPKGSLDVVEELKPMITGENLEIEGKGIDQVTREVCGNFILNANNKASIRKTRNDRRYAPFFTAQQTEGDVRRDGMDEAYMGRLFDWLNGEGDWEAYGLDYGYAVVAEYLHTYAIPPEFNPAGKCRRAPVTSSTEESIRASHSLPEQHVMEAVEEERPGFRGGWVSGSRMADLLASVNLRIAPSMRDGLMSNLGYVRHPGLKGGRPNNQVLPDAGRPVLYIHAASPHLSLTSAAEISACYERCQQVA